MWIDRRVVETRLALYIGYARDKQMQYALSDFKDKDTYIHPMWQKPQQCTKWRHQEQMQTQMQMQMQMQMKMKMKIQMQTQMQMQMQIQIQMQMQMQMQTQTRIEMMFLVSV